MKRAIALFTALALIGAGCVQKAPEDMTPEELEQAMELEMREHPPTFLPEIEQEMESAAARDMMATEEKLLTGSFTAKAHRGEGTVALIRKDGALFLAFDEAFKTDAGPRLHVFLSKHASPSSSAELHSGDVLDLGPLKSPSGGQVYELPAGADTDWKSVVVYCVPFKVVFTVATLN